ncbi:hypothetical protein FHS95_000415 [Sphingomonas naasensis]|nr:hypothetical protein [Sphingomonas naasensis]NIJ18746.1 hypothetical protein [Sphingomonas naasensis]
MHPRLKLAGAALAGILATVAVGGIAVASMDNGLGHLGRADANGDGQITRAEWVAAANTRFERLDADKDGKLTAAEMPRHHGRGDRHRGHHGPRGGGSDGDGAGPPAPPPGNAQPVAPATPAPQR